jgi:pimeloyl-ACP methyl ester carboxylesterase
LIDHLHPVGLDDRGHGRTTVPADPARLKNWRVFVDDFQRFIEYLGGPVVFIGHSRGGVAGLKLAADRPELISRLILIDPTILPYSWAFWTWPIQKLNLGRKVPIAARAARRRNGWASLDELRRSYAEKWPFMAWTPGFLDGYLKDGAVGRPGGEVELACDPAWESRCFAVFCRYAYHWVRRLTVPTMIVYGLASDTFLPPAAGRFKRLRPETVMVGIEGATHFVPMERPDATANWIRWFVQTGPAATTRGGV